MTKLSDWCCANKLAIDSKKSNFMIFQPRQKGQKYNLAFTIDGPPIEQVKGSVFLGVVIDEKTTSFGVRTMSLGRIPFWCSGKAKLGRLRRIHPVAWCQNYNRVD